MGLEPTLFSVNSGARSPGLLALNTVVPVGFEPTTLGLRVPCSTVELRNQNSGPTGNRTRFTRLRAKCITVYALSPEKARGRILH